MAESAEPRDVELLRRLASGDEDAFLEFYRRHQGGLYRYAMHMCGSPEAAADVVQDTFMTLIRQVRRFDEEKGAPAAFLFGIARNHLRKLREKEGRYVPLADEFGREHSIELGEAAGHANGNGHSRGAAGHAEGVVESLERAEVVKLLRETVLTLPDHYRDPVTLCDLEGKSYSEAASLLSCPVGTVRSRLNRARSILIEKLRPARIGTRALWARTGGAE
jgi:RNA polymerase sigma-70 factor (ECF subfamily)